MSGWGISMEMSYIKKYLVINIRSIEFTTLSSQQQNTVETEFNFQAIPELFPSYICSLEVATFEWLICLVVHSQIAKFTWTTCGPPGSCRPQVGPMWAPWTLLSFRVLVEVTPCKGSMMTSSNGNFFLVTSEFPSQRPVTQGLMFSLICAWINNGEAGDLRHHRAHYNVIVMEWLKVTKTNSMNAAM